MAALLRKVLSTLTLVLALTNGKSLTEWEKEGEKIIQMRQN